MRIEIHKAEQAEIQPLLKAIERACRYSQCSADHIEIYVEPRGSQSSSNPQWLEYGIQVMKNGSVSIYIAMIQRTTTAEFEFHS